MRWIGGDLVAYLNSLRDRVRFSKDHVEFWMVEGDAGEQFEALYLPRTDPLPVDPSFGIERFSMECGADERVVALV